MKTESKVTPFEGIASSIRKWQEIRDLINKQEVQSYVYTFWETCGYCEAFQDQSQPSNRGCQSCPLFCPVDDEEFSTQFFCAYNPIICSSLAHYALTAADGRSWDKALVATDTLLAKMRKDLYSYAVSEFTRGTKVRIHPDVKGQAKYLRGGVTNDHVGTVISTESADRMFVNFPGKFPYWHADPAEMQRAEEPTKLSLRPDFSAKTMTKDEMALLNREMWMDWIGNPDTREDADKENWPRWKKNGGDIDSNQFSELCFPCTYALHHQEECYDGMFRYCPLDYPGYKACYNASDCFNGLFVEWERLKNYHEWSRAKEIARQIGSLALRDQIGPPEEENPKPIFYHQGQKFRHEDGDRYVLTLVEVEDGQERVALVCYVDEEGLEDGDTWNDPIAVGDASQITEEEMVEIMDDGWQDNFTPMAPDEV